MHCSIKVMSRNIYPNIAIHMAVFHAGADLEGGGGGPRGYDPPKPLDYYVT